jgi:hypothetical protein
MESNPPSKRTLLAELPVHELLDAHLDLELDRLDGVCLECDPLRGPGVGVQHLERALLLARVELVRLQRLKGEYNRIGLSISKAVTKITNKENKMNSIKSSQTTANPSIQETAYFLNLVEQLDAISAN